MYVCGFMYMKKIKRKKDEELAIGIDYTTLCDDFVCVSWVLDPLVFCLVEQMMRWWPLWWVVWGQLAAAAHTKKHHGLYNQTRKHKLLGSHNQCVCMCDLVSAYGLLHGQYTYTILPKYSISQIIGFGCFDYFHGHRQLGMQTAFTNICEKYGSLSGEFLRGTIECHQYIKSSD